MRILAFSDWRIQSLERIIQIIHIENPDLILYAGDDLNRIIGFKKELYLKSLNNFIKIDLDNLSRIPFNEEIANSEKFEKSVRELTNQNKNLINDLEFPFIYVNGNDDKIIELEGDKYLQIRQLLRIDDQKYVIYDNPQGKIDLYLYKKPNIVFDDKLKIVRIEQNFPENYSEENGIYIKIFPLRGKTTFRKSNEVISIFGSGCSFGLGSKVIEPPKEYCDIYLTHLPPIGKLDLSVRFGISHIGSKKILKAIQKYCPKLVLCGHSHIWGGLNEIINKSAIINISSQDNPKFRNAGNYVLINTDNWSYKIKKLKQDLSHFSMNEIRGFSTLVKNLKRYGNFYLSNENLKVLSEKCDLKNICLRYDSQRRKFYIDPRLWEEKDHLEKEKINSTKGSRFY